MMLKNNTFLGIIEPELEVVIEPLLPSLLWLVTCVQSKIQFKKLLFFYLLYFLLSFLAVL